MAQEVFEFGAERLIAATRGVEEGGPLSRVGQLCGGIEEAVFVRS
jgi:hypothetical protein